MMEDPPYQNLGGYSSSKNDGKAQSQFSIRTPQGGLTVGPLTFSGDFSRRSSEVTPESMGIPPEVIEYFRLRNQEADSTNYGVGIFWGVDPPHFIEKVLRAGSINVNYGRRKHTFRDVMGNTTEYSDRSRGIGAQAQVLSKMFGNNAPTIGAQYSEPNREDRSFSGSVKIPIGSGDVSLQGSRSINKGRENDTTVGVRGNFRF